MSTGTDAPAAAADPTPRCHLIDTRGAEPFEFNRDSIRRRLAEDGFFWVDLHRPTDAELGVIRDGFGFHPLAVEDSEHFGQRPKFEEYDDFVFLVVYGAAPDEDGLVEVHCFFSERFLVTVHRDECPAFAEVRKRYERGAVTLEHGAMVLYRVIDALTDSFFPLLADFDDRIDQVEDDTFRAPGDESLQEIFSMKRFLVGVRKVITPQRDMFASLLTNVGRLPGMTRDDERYFRDVYDHLIRISDLVDSYRDLLTSAMDVYLSSVSNRLNVVMKQLAVIATIFLPLSFVVGFFGQNFGWMVRHISGGWTFLLLGLGTEVAVLLAFVFLFKRRGWF
ncbi:MAG: magnesium/cobalt transporter CorA [Gaiellales bacterium]